FEMAGDAVAWLWSQVKQFLPGMDGFNTDLDLTRAIAVAVAGALLLVGVAVAAWAAPFAAAALAVAGLLLAAEDLYTFFSGEGESVIGGWVEQFKTAFPELSALLGEVIGL